MKKYWAYIVQRVKTEEPNQKVVDKFPRRLSKLFKPAGFVTIAALAKPALNIADFEASLTSEGLYKRQEMLAFKLRLLIK